MMPADPARCALDQGARCAWDGLCAPDRCIAQECADSPNYAAFAPRPPCRNVTLASDKPAWHRDGVAPSRPAHRGVFPRLRALWDDGAPFDAAEVVAGLLAGAGLVVVGLALAGFWGVL